MVKAVDESNFQEEVIQASSEGRVIVDFNADWCGPCQALAPILEEAESEIEKESKAKIVSVNIDENQTLAENFNISSIPCLVLVENGQEIDRFVGLASKKKILKFLGI